LTTILTGATGVSSMRTLPQSGSRQNPLWLLR
jgi:hypothetical protein